MADAYGHDLICPAAGKLDRSPQLPGKLAAILRNRIRRGTDPQQKRTAGWINANGTQKVKLTRGTHDGSTAIDYNTDGNGYKTIANATPAGSSGGYISSMKTEAFGRLPVTASGSSSTYEADGMWYNNGQVNYAFVGGTWGNGLVVGPFCAILDIAASDANSNYGAALSCKPLAAA